jgi:hypothetical protein
MLPASCAGRRIRVSLSPHRSRILLPLPEGDAQLDALIVHALTHLLVSEIIGRSTTDESAAK